jgi:lactoylglutathione lyase
MFHELFPILTVDDMPRALEFYRDLLGCKVTYEFRPDGHPDGPPSYVGLQLGISHLGVGLGEAPSADRTTLWVYADDCDNAVALLRDSGVPVLQEPADQPWGERMATVTDPTGNKVIVASRTSSLEGLRTPGT